MGRRSAATAGCCFGARDRTRTGMASRPKHFKCLVSTCFTTRAAVDCSGAGRWSGQPRGGTLIFALRGLGMSACDCC